MRQNYIKIILYIGFIPLNPIIWMLTFKKYTYMTVAIHLLTPKKSQKIPYWKPPKILKEFDKKSINFINNLSTHQMMLFFHEALSVRKKHFPGVPVYFFSQTHNSFPGSNIDKNLNLSIFQEAFYLVIMCHYFIIELQFSGPGHLLPLCPKWIFVLIK